MSPLLRLWAKLGSFKCFSSQSWYQFCKSFLYSFDTINVFAQIRMPNSISVLQLGTNHRLVKSDIGILVKVVKGSDNESEHTVCLLNFGGNVLVKFKVILEYYSLVPFFIYNF